jgi:hypothetical protein
VIITPNADGRFTSGHLRRDALGDAAVAVRDVGLVELKGVAGAVPLFAAARRG